MLELLMGFGLRGGGDREPLLAGTYEQGYYGEVLATAFITGNQLATQIGLTAGTAFNSEAGWLKFSLENKTLYVAKKPFRYGISWNSVNARGAVYGTMQVEINGKLYKVRLLKGRGDGLTTTVTAGMDTEPTWGSEWNRLMYHVSASPNGGTMTSEGISVGDWAQFTNDELGIVSSPGGNRNICMDTIENGYYICRGIVSAGAPNLSYAGAAPVTNSNAVYGWRPCLELVL